jgi:hypothetical protein
MHPQPYGQKFEYLVPKYAHISVSSLMELATKSIFQSSFKATLSQISKFLEVLNLVSDALSDPTMPYRPNLRPHKHAPLNHMARNLNP